MIDRLRSSVVGRLIVSAVAVGAAMSVTVIFVLATTTGPSLRREVAARNLELAARLAVLVDDRVASSVRTLRLASLDRGLVEGTRAATSALNVYLRMAPAAKRVVLLDEDGRGIAAASVDRLLEPDDITTEEPPSMDEVRLVANGDGPPVLEAWVPVERPPGVVIGSLVASLRLDILATHLETTTLGSSAVAYIVDREGNVLVHPARDRVVGQDRIDLSAALLREDGGSATTTIDGEPVILAATPLQSIPTMVVVEESEAAAFASLGSAIGQLTQILVIVIAATVAAIAFVGHRLLRPLRALTVAVDRIGRGDRSARVGRSGPDEVGRLAAAFDRMATDSEDQWSHLSSSHDRLVTTQEQLQRHVLELERTHEALASSEERFRQLAEHVTELFWIIDASTAAVLYVSPAYEKITGRSREALYADPASFLELVHYDDVDKLPGDLEGLRDQPHDTEYRIVRDDGSVRWLWSRSFAVRDEAGRTYRVVGITEDVTERKRAEEALRESERRLRALDEMKNSFLTAVSHELRTPLAAVVGFADTLAIRGAQLTPEQRIQFIGRIGRNALKLQSLLSDLLDLDRLERGITAPRRRRVDVTRIIREVVGSTDAIAGRPVTIGSAPAPAEVDPTMVERIVENLLVNAARHTPNGTDLIIAATSGRDGVEIVVSDRGPGVPDDLKQAIFEPFRQAGSQPHPPGVGIGLALVSRFAELHGGRAWVEDRAGGGSSFHVLLACATEDEIAISSPHSTRDRNSRVRG